MAFFSAIPLPFRNILLTLQAKEIKMKRIASILIATLCCFMAARAASLHHLRVNRLAEPAGVIRGAQFSWMVSAEGQDVHQVAYAIRAAASAEALKAGGRALLWDTGRVESGETLQVSWQGRKMPSASRVWWQLEVWLSTGEHVVSPVQTFQTALTPRDWGRARWIGVNGFDSITVDSSGRQSMPAHYLRREFDVQRPVRRATLYVSGIGHTAMFVNGKPVSADVFGTVQTNWDKTVYYNTYDVTALMRRGRNAMGMELSAGYALGLRRDCPSYGGPRMMSQLIIETDTDTLKIASDTQWKATDRGPIRSNNLYDGELYDARMELGAWTMPGYNDSRWAQADEMPMPEGNIEPQPCPGIRTQAELHPVSIKALGGGRYIADMGQNMVGQLRVSLTGRAGQPVVMRFAEGVNADTTRLYTDNLRSALCTNTYIPARGGAFSYQPTTVYQGFRFVEISGLARQPRPQDLTGCVQYDEMEERGTFECDNELLNQLHRNALWGIRGNYHGMPTDCPQRDERLGWTGDRVTGCWGENTLLDNGALYYKWLRDLQDTQDDRGQLADIAPEYWKGLRNTNVTWTGAAVYVTYMLYRRYGDISAVRTYYPMLQNWVRYIMQNGMQDGIVTKDRYGDWCMPPEREELIHSEDPSRKTEGAILSTTVFYDILRMMREMATLLSNTADVQYFARTAAQMKAAYNQKYFNADSAFYGNNTVTANILSLQLGLVPDGYEEGVMQNIVRVTEEDFQGHVSCGVLGIQHLMRGLTRRGQLPLAWRIVTQRSYPSYGYMIDHGATTIWELWNGNTANPAMNSGNHVMLLGDLLLWYYEDLAGIRNAEGSLGYKHLLMAPCFPEELHHVKASQLTASGMVRSEWNRQGDHLEWNIELPATTQATLRLPARFQVNPTGPGVRSVQTEGDETVIELGSGRYTLRSQQ